MNVETVIAKGARRRRLAAGLSVAACLASLVVAYVTGVLSLYVGWLVP